jgi:hypothetical protein
MKKAHTATQLELLPALIEAIFGLQQQKATKQPTDTEEVKEPKTEEKQKRLRKNAFYKSVTTRIADIIKDVSAFYIL